MDDQIIELLGNQDEHGLVMLQHQYDNLIRYFVRAILKDERDIEECISDIYLQIWKKHNLFDPSRGKLSTWLAAISRNTALNYKKRKQVITTELSSDFCSTQTPEESLLIREDMQRLVNCIANLSAGDCRLFYRKYYFLQSTQQIASELGLSERSVEGKLYRMRKRLQKKLEVTLNE